MLQFKNATSYFDSIRLGNNYKDVVDVKDNNGKNEKVEIDHVTGKDVLKINMNIFEKGTIIPSCPKCEACPEQKNAKTNQKTTIHF